MRVTRISAAEFAARVDQAAAISKSPPSASNTGPLDDL